MAGRSSFKKQQRLIIVSAGVVVMALVTFLVLEGLGKDSLNLFVQPHEVVERGLQPGTRLRLGGLVVPGSVNRAEDGVTVRFAVTDCKSDMVVAYKGLLPDLFREGQEVVTDGILTAEGGLDAESVLAKHDENYAPPGAIIRDKDGCKARTQSVANAYKTGTDRR